jgi:signal peptidase II
VFLGNAPQGSPTPWFHGQVIDMFYLDICYCHIPSWVPIVGNEYYPLWPIFNVADASIFIGVAIILIMQKKYFKDHKIEEAEDKTTGSEHKVS